MSDNNSKQLRDALRAKIFDGKNTVPKRKLIKFFGEEIELRQPTLSNILAAQRDEDRESAVIGALIDHAYVVGTDEHIFSVEDQDQLLAMPFGDDFVNVSKALEEMSTVNFRGESASTEERSDTSAGNEAGMGTPQE